MCRQHPLEMSYGGDDGGLSRSLRHVNSTEGLEFVDELRQTIASHLENNLGVGTEEDSLDALEGRLCYARPEDVEEDRWCEARAIGGIPLSPEGEGRQRKGPRRSRAAAAASAPSPAAPTDGVSGGASSSTAPPPTFIGLSAAQKVFGAPPPSSKIRWPPMPLQSWRPARHEREAPSRRRRGRASAPTDAAGSDDSGESGASCESETEILRRLSPTMPGKRGSDERRNTAQLPLSVPTESEHSNSHSPSPAPDCEPQPQGEAEPEPPLLEFSSCFESGNLKYVVYNSTDDAYDLVLENDVHTRGHTQWFYFAIRGGEPGRVYRFRIVNLSKAKSLFRLGMRPLVWSEAYAASQVNPGGTFCQPWAFDAWRGAASEVWRPAGQEVRYHRSRPGRGGASSKCYTLSFDYSWEYPSDCVYVAYFVPFTYTMLRSNLSAIIHDPVLKKMCRLRCLCPTMGDVRCDLLEISNWNISSRMKKAIIVSARVHPGETNASWLMHGFLGFLLSPCPEAQVLRDNFVLQIVPMLNPDGVICGNYRCGLSGVDLNRQWRAPNETLHGTIHFLKRLIARSKNHYGVSLYLDLHGHSRRCGIFSYACGKFPKDDHRRHTVRVYPRLLGMLTPEFTPGNCRWQVGKGKRGTGRVVVAKDLGLTYTYTIEASFFGAPMSGWKEEGENLRRLTPEEMEAASSRGGVQQSKQAACREASREAKAQRSTSSAAEDEDETGARTTEEDIPQVILFTPYKLEEMGANLAKAIILQQKMGPSVRNALQRSTANGVLDQRTRPRLIPAIPTEDQNGRLMSPPAASESTSSVSGSDSEGDAEADPESPTSPTSSRPPLGDADADASPSAASGAASDSAEERLLSVFAPVLPEAAAVVPPHGQPPTVPVVADGGSGAQAVGTRGYKAATRAWSGLGPCDAEMLSSGGTSKAVGDVEEAPLAPVGRHELMASGVAEDNYLGIDVEAVFEEVRNDSPASSESESIGSDSDPSEDNLGNEELTSLCRALAQQRPPPVRKRTKKTTARRKEPESASKRKGAVSAINTGRGRSKPEKPDREKLTARHSIPGSTPASTLKAVRPELQKIVAFGQTTYVAPGFLSTTVSSFGSSPNLSLSEPTSPNQPPRRGLGSRAPAAMDRQMAATASVSPFVAATSLNATVAEPKSLQWPAIPQVTLQDNAPGARPANAAQLRHSSETAMAMLGTTKDRFAIHNSSGAAAAAAPAGTALRSRTTSGRFNEEPPSLSRRLHMRNVSSSFLQQRGRYGGEASATGSAAFNDVAAAMFVHQNGPLPRSSSRPLTPIQLGEVPPDSILEPLLSMVQDVSGNSTGAAQGLVTGQAAVMNGVVASPPVAVPTAPASAPGGGPGNRSLRPTVGPPNTRQMSVPPVMGQHTVLQAQAVGIQDVLRTQLTSLNMNRSPPRAGLSSPPFL
eukprot:TRINITY_DN59524_c0_g1_i1.p1 TRINITY_DN59524_c0_g1~~TRINITY_DN59524_c0_g1_i1.p1  ORF type:complete len:1422 (+),score=248.30 TRINITY_DN59524_c0_g1_i1:170-4435(+)